MRNLHKFVSLCTFVKTKRWVSQYLPSQFLVKLPPWALRGLNKSIEAPVLGWAMHQERLCQKWTSCMRRFWLLDYRQCCFSKLHYCQWMVSHKSETGRGPERSCRINTQWSSLALERHHTSTTEKTWVAYGNLCQKRTTYAKPYVRRGYGNLCQKWLEDVALVHGGVYVPCIYMHTRWELP